MDQDFDPEGRRLPIKVDSTSNGEYAPRPLTRLQRAANAHAQACVGEAAKRAGMGRRPFLKTLAGSAATLLAFNAVHARAGVTGRRFDLPAEAAYDPQLAQATLAGDEFIFDIQTHCVDPREIGPRARAASAGATTSTGCSASVRSARAETGSAIPPSS